MPTVRELITKIGFEVDNTKLGRFDNQLQGLQNKIRASTRGLDTLANKLVGIGTRLTAFVTLPIAAAGIFSLKAASDVEQLNVAFTTMLGSEEEALALTEELINFAARTPFTIPGIQANAKQLLGMGVEAEKLIPTLKAIGDVAAGVGADMSRVALNFGQVRTQGKLTGRELRDFAVQGIPLIAELAKNFGVTEKEVAGLVSAGKVGFKDVEKAFISMSSEGGKFFDLMIKQSGTLGGLFSNFLDNLFKGAAAIGQVAVEALHLKAIFRGLNSILEALVTFFETLPRPLQVIILAFILLAAALGPLLLLIGFAIKSFLILSLAASLLNIALLPLFLKFILLAAVIAGIATVFAVVFKEIDGWIKGNRSFIGIFLGDYETLISNLKRAWEGFTTFLVNVVTFQWKAAFKNFLRFLEIVLDRIKAVINSWRTLFNMTKIDIPGIPGAAGAAGEKTPSPSGFLNRASKDFAALAGLFTGKKRLESGFIIQNEINNTFQGAVTDESVRQVEKASSAGAEQGTRDAVNSLGVDSLVTESVGQ